MVKATNDLVSENKVLIQERNDLGIKLSQANEIIEGIKAGNIDAILVEGNGNSQVLASGSADQAYRRFIENMSEGVVILYADGIILYSNSSFAKMINVPLENIIGANFRNFIPAENHPVLDDLLHKGPRHNAKMELCIVDRLGASAHFVVSFNSLVLQDLLAFNLVWTDVTEQKNAEENLISVNEDLKVAIEERTTSEAKVVILNRKLNENIDVLQDANIELASFAHIASHDLQEPLRKIMTYSSILRSDYFDTIDEQGQNCINKMVSASERMRNLINDILEYAELSKDEIEFKPTSIQTVINEVLSDLEIVIAETKAEFTIENELPVIEANASQMRQLFQNLISNSLKFIDKNNAPQISIGYESMYGRQVATVDESRWDEPFYAFHIRDNGIGFDSAYIHKIFTIFQKLNSNAVYPRTGIGLAICNKIVKKHAGFISAESKRNEGAVFTITLPASQGTSRLH